MRSDATPKKTFDRRTIESLDNLHRAVLETLADRGEIIITDHRGGA